MPTVLLRCRFLSGSDHTPYLHHEVPLWSALGNFSRISFIPRLEKRSCCKLARNSRQLNIRTRPLMTKDVDFIPFKEKSIARRYLNTTSQLHFLRLPSEIRIHRVRCKQPHFMRRRWFFAKLGSQLCGCGDAFRSRDHSISSESLHVLGGAKSSRFSDGEWTLS